MSGLRQVSVMGSTGSIGVSTLDVIARHPERFAVYALAAHSDGDVLIHALCDALLGALGLGDIGRLYPDDDSANKGRDSREFLREIAGRVKAAGYRLGNADLTIIAQAPKMAPHIGSMRALLAQDLETAVEQLNIKATTTEGLGFAGRQEGIAAHAVVLLSPAT